MISVHIRQAALQARHEGWFLKTQHTHGIVFSRTELALAASTFLGDLTPETPDDTLLIIHELPHICAGLFSSGTIFCKQCGGTKQAPIPTFATNSTWAMPTWRSLMSCLKEDCIPFPWQIHQKNRSWILSLRNLDIGYTILSAHFPMICFPLSHLREIFRRMLLMRRIYALQDSFVQTCMRRGLPDTIGLLKSIMGKLWVSIILSIGYCQLTVETAKRLQVTGIVLLSASSEGWGAFRKEQCACLCSQ